MKLNLNKEEIFILKLAAKDMMEDGHWGNLTAYLGEEKHLLKKLESVREGEVEFYNLEMRVLRYWLEGSNLAINSDIYDELHRKIKPDYSGEQS